jgi:phage shock protein C
MQTVQTNLFARDDTFLGVCQAIGEDFGFNPNWLRVVFGVTLLLNPVAAFVGYFGAGALVLVSRLVFPNPRSKAPPAQAEPAEASHEPVEAASEVEERLPIAA